MRPYTLKMQIVDWVGRIYRTGDSPITLVDKKGAKEVCLLPDLLFASVTGEFSPRQFDQ